MNSYLPLNIFTLPDINGVFSKMGGGFQDKRVCWFVMWNCFVPISFPCFQKSIMITKLGYTFVDILNVIKKKEEEKIHLCIYGHWYMYNCTHTTCYIQNHKRQITVEIVTSLFLWHWYGTVELFHELKMTELSQ